MSAPSAITFFNSFREFLGDGTLDMNSNAFKVSLHTSDYAPSAANHTVYADLSNELPTANGYTVGGYAMTNVTWTKNGATVAWDADDIVVNATDAGLTFRYAVIRAVGTLNGRVDPLVGYMLIDSAPADVSVSAGNAGTIKWNAAGIIALT